MSIYEHWRKWRLLSWSRRCLVCEAAWCLLLARLKLLVLPFPRIARRLGQLHVPSERGLYGARDPERARIIAWAIDRAAYVLPLPLVCLPRALAAQRMLTRRRLDCRVHFSAGRATGDRSLQAHAWVDSGGVPVTSDGRSVGAHELGYYAGEFSA